MFSCVEYIVLLKIHNGIICNALNNSPQAVTLCILVIILATFLCSLIFLLLYHHNPPPKRSIPYLKCRWKYTCYTFKALMEAPSGDWRWPTASLQAVSHKLRRSPVHPGSGPIWEIDRVRGTHRAQASDSGRMGALPRGGGG